MERGAGDELNATKTAYQKSASEIKGWVPIARAFIRRADLSDKARFLASVLASFAGRDGIAYPSAKTLQRITGWSVNPLKRARSELAKAGMIVRLQAHGGRGRFGTVRWFITGEVLHRKHGKSASGEKRINDTLYQSFARDMPEEHFTGQR